MLLQKLVQPAHGLVARSRRARLGDRRAEVVGGVDVGAAEVAPGHTAAEDVPVPEGRALGERGLGNGVDAIGSQDLAHALVARATPAVEPAGLELRIEEGVLVAVRVERDRVAAELVEGVGVVAPVPVEGGDRVTVDGQQVDVHLSTGHRRDVVVRDGNHDPEPAHPLAELAHVGARLPAVRFHRQPPGVRARDAPAQPAQPAEALDRTRPEPAQGQLEQILGDPGERTRDGVLVLDLDQEQVGTRCEARNDLAEPLLGGVEEVARVDRARPRAAAQDHRALAQQPRGETAEVELRTDIGSGPRNQVEARLLDHVVEPVDVPDPGELVIAPGRRVVAPGIVDVDGVQSRTAHFLQPVAPQLGGREAKVVQRARAEKKPLSVDREALVIELDLHLPPFEESVYSRAASQRSASRAAMQPLPAAVTAWRYVASTTSPQANTPSTFVHVEPGFTRM